MINPAFKQRLADLGIVGRSALLALLFALLWALSVPVAFSLSGIKGILAALSAAIVVWIASAAGMAIGELFHGPNEAVAKLLFGMVIRMTVPLIACLLVLLTGSRLATAGFVFYVLGFYLLALPVDTVLAVLQTAAAKESAKPNGLN
jgi:hypothetical protein